MNKIYKLIWSKALNRIIVVPEGAKGGRGKKAGRRKLATALVSSIALGAPVLAQSVLPTGGKIVSGQGAIVTNGNAMTIHQSTDKLIANWQSFSIGKDAAVTFLQPGASSVALNRVVGQVPSQILGSLNANGQVFLVNPNGVLIGQGGSVQTGAFVASTLGLTDQDFLAGKYHFSGEGRAIVNQGGIKGNVVALIAPSVINEGTIKGNTVLAAGTDALLDFDGDGLLSVQVKASTLATLVENKGLIQADGGTAILTAKGASDALQGIVNNTGTVQARTIANKKGRILLLGDMDHGEANVAGTLDVSAPHGGDGGFIETSAAKVSVADSARITTQAESGKTGVWLIDPNDFTIAASGGNITGSTLASQLAGSNVTISTATQGTAGGNGDIFVNDSVSWSANTLTLHAERNIAINTAMNASATAGLALEYGQGAVAAGNSATYTINAPVNLASTGSFSTKLGSDGAVANYTIVTSLGAAASSNDGTLQGIRGNLSGKYVLGADIDASATSAWNAGAGFAPIGDNSTGNSASRFTATFDGLGHVITGLAINRPATNFVGLFGYVDTNGVVRNVGLSGGSVVGNSHVGPLAGAVSGAISASYVTGSVSGADTTGGLAGKNFGTITQSYATGSVSGQLLIGGLVGVNDGGTVSYAYATGDVTASDANSLAGGLVGYLNGGAIANSYATGQVSGNSNVGGLLGFNNSGTISNTYATGNVMALAANSLAGGLVGYLNGGTIANSYATGQVSGINYVGGLIGFHNSGTVSNTYAAGLVTGAGTDNVGGLVGFVNNGTTISNSYWDTATTGLNVGCGTTSTGTCGTTALTTAQMKNPFTFIDTGWNFATVWGKSDSGGNNGYMVLRALDGTAYDDYVRLSNTNLSKTYGDANPSLSGITLDGVGTNNVTLAWDSAIAATTNAGTYAYGTPNVLSVTGNNGRSVYADYGSGALTIDKAALTVTASNASKTYDGLAFSGGNGVTYSGFVNGETASVLSGAASFGGTAQGAVNAGSYTLTASGLSSGNYDITYANGALAVGKAALTVTASNASKTYDGQAFSGGNGATYSGFVNGETASVLSGAASFGGTAQGAVNAGSYTLTASGLSSGNYDITYANGALAVNKATISAITGITANNKTYDGTTAATLNTANAAFTGMIAGDNLSVTTATGVFTDKNAGTGKTVNITGLALGDADAGNYTLAATTATTTADIAKAAISAVAGITAANKIYDGTTAAMLNTSGAAFTGMIAGDSLNVATAAGNFADASLGVNKTVFITGLSLGGGDADNYALTNTSVTTAADISAIVAPPLSPQQIAIGSTGIIGGGTFAAPASAILSAGTEPIDAGATSEGENKTRNSPICVPGGNQNGASQCGSQGNAL